MSYYGVHGELPEISAEEEKVGANISSDSFGSGPRMRRHMYETNWPKTGIERNRDQLSGADPSRRYDFKVKDLSRLWLYVNGRMPNDEPFLMDQARYELI
jgi:hypothetical protein